jgi:hypothetical protein
MHPVIDALHTESAQFPQLITAVKLAVALAIGLLIGFERQWSNKDYGVRTFSFTALLGGPRSRLPARWSLTCWLWRDGRQTSSLPNGSNQPWQREEPFQ